MATVRKIETPEYGILTRREFLEEFAYRYRRGQHVTLFGPTGRGKTTLAGQMLAVTHPPKSDVNGLITIQLGPDQALEHLGKPMDSWPPRIPIKLFDREDNKPHIYRYQPEPSKPEDFLRIRQTAARILRWFFSARNWTLFIPDLQVVADPGMMGLGKEVDQLIITTRKHQTSIWVDAQAPRWVPRSTGDMTSHLLVWRNRDEGTLTRLKQICGLDLGFLSDLLKSIDYHDCIWIDNVANEMYVVRKGNTP